MKKAPKILLILIALVILATVITLALTIKPKSENADNTNQFTEKPKATVAENNITPALGVEKYFQYTTETESNLFDRYRIEYPESWNIKTLNNDTAEEITLTKDNAELNIVITEYGHLDACVLNSDEQNDLVIKISDHEYKTVKNDFGEYYYFEQQAGSGNYIFCGKCVDEDSELCTTTAAGDIQISTKNKNHLEDAIDIIKSFSKVGVFQN